MDSKRGRLDPANLISLIVVAGYLAATLVQLGDSFIIDEMEFPRLAEAVAETGRPVYYRGEQSPTHPGAFHPPLYGYALGGWIAIFGFSEVTVRLFGVVLMLGTALLCVRIVEHWGLAGRWGKPICLALFLLHPFVIQSALLPDIDGTVLLFATVLALLTVTKIPDEEDWKRSATKLGLAFAFALATKLTAVLIVPTILVGLAFSMGFKAALRIVGVAGLFGVGVFVSVWWALAAVASLPFAYPFEFFVQSGLKGGVADTSWAELLGRLIPRRHAVFWLGISLPIGALFATGVLVTRWKTNRGQRLALTYAIWSFGILLFYFLITGPPFGFPKYLIAALPTMTILCMFLVDAIGTSLQARRAAPWLFVATTVGLAAFWGWRFSIVSGDGLYVLPGRRATAILVALSLVAAFLMVRPIGKWLRAGIMMALLIATVSSGLGTAVAQAVDDASVRYFPGEIGFDETVERVMTLANPAHPILVPKDIGSATYNRYHEQERLFRRPDQLAAVLADSSVTLAVVRTDWDYSYTVFPEVQQIIEEQMELSETIGGFLIYVRRAD